MIEQDGEAPDFPVNVIHCGDSGDMEALPDASVHLVVTSPPYNVGKDYDTDLALEYYRVFLSRVWREVRRVLAPDGRVCINIANVGRRPYLPLHAYIIEDMLSLGFLCLLYTSPSPRDRQKARMPSSA